MVKIDSLKQKSQTGAIKLAESSLGDLRRLLKDGGDAKKGLGKAQYSSIKKE